MPRLLANWIIKLRNADDSNPARVARSAKLNHSGGVLVMGVMSQNLIPIHIAFIPLLVPPLIGVMNELKMDRRLAAWCDHFRPRHDLHVRADAASAISSCTAFSARTSRKPVCPLRHRQPDGRHGDPHGLDGRGLACRPARYPYRKPREYEQRETSFELRQRASPVEMKKVTGGHRRPRRRFVIQAVMADGFRPTRCSWVPWWACAADARVRVVPWQQADDVFSGGMKMMSLSASS